MKTQTQAEIENWAQTFSLERHSLVGAFEKYEHLLCQLEGRDVTDGELAMSLAQLRKNVGRESRDEEAAPELARQLEQVTARLESARERMKVLEEAGHDSEFASLTGRLEAAQTLFSTLRAALARRTR